MAISFSYRKIFIDKDDPVVAKAKIIALIDRDVKALDFRELNEEKESDWSYIIANGNDYWLHLADVGWMNFDDDIVKQISQIYPVISIGISDEFLLILKLHQNGVLKSQFANSDFFNFEVQDFNIDFQVEDWNPYLNEEGSIEELAQLWQINQLENGRYRTAGRFEVLLTKTSKLFGWEEEMNYGGYYIDSEGEVWRNTGFWLDKDADQKKYQPVLKHYQFIGENTQRKYASIWESLGW